MSINFLRSWGDQTLFLHTKKKDFKKYIFSRLLTFFSASIANRNSKISKIFLFIIFSLTKNCLVQIFLAERVCVCVITICVWFFRLLIQSFAYFSDMLFLYDRFGWINFNKKNRSDSGPFLFNPYFYFIIFFACLFTTLWIDGQVVLILFSTWETIN